MRSVRNLVFSSFDMISDARLSALSFDVVLRTVSGVEKCCFALKVTLPFDWSVE
jgi:hypothetical protein